MTPLKGIVKKLIVGYQRTLMKTAEQESGFTSVLSRPIIINPVVEVRGTTVLQEQQQEKHEVNESEIKKETEPESKAKYKGFEIPQDSFQSLNLQNTAVQQIKTRVNLTYPLVPRKPERGERVLAYAKIFWDEKQNRHFYQIVEPQLTDYLKEVLIKIKEILEQRLDIEFNQLRKFEALDFLQKEINEIISYYRFKLTDDDKKVLQYFIQRDFVGLERIEPIMMDDQIEDISCDGLDIPLFVFHRNPMLGSIMTNVAFHNVDELDSFVMRLSQLCGKSVSVASPLLSGSLPDGSRVQAMLATDIARRGSNFTIRKFTEEPLTPIHLLNYGTIDVKTLAYLWMILDFGKSILISGGTATGKTTLLNVLSLFIRPEKKIVSIEDTPELKLPHPHWVPAVARTAITIVENRRIGEIDLFDLLKESLRQRPDYIIVGEVRGKEAYVLFQEMATGHPSLATIHAENMQKLLDRLKTPPIELPVGLIVSANTVIFLLATRYKNRQIRRVGEVVEIIALDETTGAPIINQVFKWNPISDTFDISNRSILLKQISDATGMSEKEISEELKGRMLVLEWMRFRKITNYRDVNAVINMYYNFPERVVASISSSLPR
jgi:flagellar protein FlaI